MSKHGRGFTLIELLVAVAIIGILVSLALPAVQQSRAAARRVQCLNQLRQLGLALHSYHESRQVLPAGAYVQSSSFPPRSGWGWGAMILPHVDAANLYNQLDFNIPTAAGSNEESLRVTLPIWLCPSDAGDTTMTAPLPTYPDVTAATGNYCGNDALLGGMSSIRFSDITDGLSNTLLLGERVSRPATPTNLPFTAGWYGFLAKPDMHVNNSIPYSPVSAAYPINRTLGGTTNFSSRHIGGANFVFADGSAKLLSENMDGGLYEALGTPNGQEVVEF